MVTQHRLTLIARNQESTQTKNVFGCSPAHNKGLVTNDPCGIHRKCTFRH